MKDSKIESEVLSKIVMGEGRDSNVGLAVFPVISGCWVKWVPALVVVGAKSIWTVGAGVSRIVVERECKRISVRIEICMVDISVIMVVVIHFTVRRSLTDWVWLISWFQERNDEIQVSKTLVSGVSHDKFVSSAIKTTVRRTVRGSIRNFIWTDFFMGIQFLCAKRRKTEHNFSKKFSFKGIAKELNYKMIGVSKIPSDRKCPGNRK